MTKRAGLALITAALACFVVAGVVSTLSISGYTEEAETFCGHEEHEHSKDCYKKELTCGKEETDGHTHSDACYEDRVVSEERVLVCGMDETPDQPAVPGHTHTDACFEEDEDGNKTLVCGLEETPDQPAVPGHTHTDACYETVTNTERVLVCGQEEGEAHKHSKSCYTEKLVCGKEEHKHKEECYCDSSADVESAATWEATLPSGLSGVWADDVIAVAESQLGYTESKRNFQPGPGRRLGYSRYGAWYGNAYGDWCAMYVSFCLNYAHIPAEAMPRDASCPNWISTLKARNMFRDAHGQNAYVPVKGDIIFFDWEGDGTSDHVGLVVEVDKDNNYIRTIEGNSGDVVQYCSYALNSGQIVGYGELPVNPDDPTVKAKQEEDKQQAETQGTAVAKDSVDALDDVHVNGAATADSTKTTSSASATASASTNSEPETAATASETAESTSKTTSSNATPSKPKGNETDKSSTVSASSASPNANQTTSSGTYSSTKETSSVNDASSVQGDGYSVVTTRSGKTVRLEDDAQVMNASQVWANMLPGGSSAE